jgi:hypothetical protein
LDQSRDGTTLIDCTATFEEDGAAKVLTCSSIKVGAAKGTPWSTGQVPVWGWTGMLW